MSEMFAGTDIYIPYNINETDTLAGTSQEIVAPTDGFIRSITNIVQKAVTTGGTVKVAVGTTDVVGAVVTVPDGAAKGSILTASTTKDHDTRKVSKGQRIQIIPHANFNTAGAVSGHIVLNTAF